PVGGRKNADRPTEHERRLVNASRWPPGGGLKAPVGDRKGADRPTEHERRVVNAPRWPPGGPKAPAGGRKSADRPTEHERRLVNASRWPPGGPKSPCRRPEKAPTALRSTNVGWSTHRVGHRGARKAPVGGRKNADRPTEHERRVVNAPRWPPGGPGRPLLAAGRTPTALRQTKFDQATVTPTAQDVQDRSPNGPASHYLAPCHRGQPHPARHADGACRHPARHSGTYLAVRCRHPDQPGLGQRPGPGLRSPAAEAARAPGAVLPARRQRTGHRRAAGPGAAALRALVADRGGGGQRPRRWPAALRWTVA